MLEKEVRDLIEKKLKEVNIYVDSVAYENENGNNFLRITIDSDEGIDVDKCVLATNIINPLLDEADLIEDSYILDISSKESGD